MIFRPVLLLSLFTFVTACSSPVATRAPRPLSDTTVDDVGVGLFPADAERLDDTEIQRILEFPWRVPDDIRIAMLRLQDPSEREPDHPRYFWRGYSESNTALQTATRAVEILYTVPGVFDVSYIPSFLLPQQKSVALIREAAARYQADWTLVYESEFQTNPKSHVWSSDEVFGVGVVEAALIDTRTGIIPFSSRARAPFRMSEEDRDADLRALTLRAEQEVLDQAMAEIANALAAFVRNARQR